MAEDDRVLEMLRFQVTFSPQEIDYLWGRDFEKLVDKRLAALKVHIMAACRDWWAQREGEDADSGAS